MAAAAAGAVQSPVIAVGARAATATQPAAPAAEAATPMATVDAEGGMSHSAAALPATGPPPPPVPAPTSHRRAGQQGLFAPARYFSNEELRASWRQRETHLLRVLSARTLDTIKSKFEDYEERGYEGLTAVQFVDAMLALMGRLMPDKQEFVIQLLELFDAVDVNGDRTLEWEELLNYVVQTLSSDGGASAGESARSSSAVSASGGAGGGAGAWSGSSGREYVDSSPRKGGAAAAMKVGGIGLGQHLERTMHSYEPALPPSLAAKGDAEKGLRSGSTEVGDASSAGARSGAGSSSSGGGETAGGGDGEGERGLYEDTFDEMRRIVDPADDAQYVLGYRKGSPVVEILKWSSQEMEPVLEPYRRLRHGTALYSHFVLVAHFIPEARLIASCTRQGITTGFYANFYDFETGELKRRVPIDYPCLAITYSAANKAICFFAAPTGLVYLFDVYTGALLRSVTLGEGAVHAAAPLAPSSSEATIVGTNLGTISMLEDRTWRILPGATVLAHEFGVKAIAYSASYARIASIGYATGKRTMGSSADDVHAILLWDVRPWVDFNTEVRRRSNETVATAVRAAKTRDIPGDLAGGGGSVVSGAAAHGTGVKLAASLGLEAADTDSLNKLATTAMHLLNRRETAAFASHMPARLKSRTHLRIAEGEDGRGGSGPDDDHATTRRSEGGAGTARSGGRGGRDTGRSTFSLPASTFEGPTRAFAAETIIPIALRGHTTQPQALAMQDSDGVQPHLISSDSAGVIITWDLLTTLPLQRFTLCPYPTVPPARITDAEERATAPAPSKTATASAAVSHAKAEKARSRSPDHGAAPPAAAASARLPSVLKGASEAGKTTSGAITGANSPSKAAARVRFPDMPATSRRPSDPHRTGDGGGGKGVPAPVGAIGSSSPGPLRRSTFRQPFASPVMARAAAEYAKVKHREGIRVGLAVSEALGSPRRPGGASLPEELGEPGAAGDEVAPGGSQYEDVALPGLASDADAVLFSEKGTTSALAAVIITGDGACIGGQTASGKAALRLFRRRSVTQLATSITQSASDMITAQRHVLTHIIAEASQPAAGGGSSSSGSMGGGGSLRIGSRSSRLASIAPISERASPTSRSTVTSRPPSSDRRRPGSAKRPMSGKRPSSAGAAAVVAAVAAAQAEALALARKRSSMDEARSIAVIGLDMRAALQSLLSMLMDSPFLRAAAAPVARDADFLAFGGGQETLYAPAVGVRFDITFSAFAMDPARVAAAASVFPSSVDVSNDHILGLGQLRKLPASAVSALLVCGLPSGLYGETRHMVLAGGPGVPRGRSAPSSLATTATQTTLINATDGVADSATGGRKGPPTGGNANASPHPVHPSEVPFTPQWAVLGTPTARHGVATLNWMQHVPPREGVVAAGFLAPILLVYTLTASALVTWDMLTGLPFRVITKRNIFYASAAPQHAGASARRERGPWAQKPLQDPYERSRRAIVPNMTAELTAAVADDLHRKVVVTDSVGNVYVVNPLTGNVMKQLHPNPTALGLAAARTDSGSGSDDSATSDEETRRRIPGSTAPSPAAMNATAGQQRAFFGAATTAYVRGRSQVLCASASGDVWMTDESTLEGWSPGDAAGNTLVRQFPVPRPVVWLRRQLPATGAREGTIASLGLVSVKRRNSELEGDAGTEPEEGDAAAHSAVGLALTLETGLRSPTLRLPSGLLSVTGAGARGGLAIPAAAATTAFTVPGEGRPPPARFAHPPLLAMPVSNPVTPTPHALRTGSSSHRPMLRLLSDRSIGGGSDGEPSAASGEVSAPLPSRRSPSPSAARAAKEAAAGFVTHRARTGQVTAMAASTRLNLVAIVCPLLIPGTQAAANGAPPPQPPFAIETPDAAAAGKAATWTSGRRPTTASVRSPPTAAVGGNGADADGHAARFTILIYDQRRGTLLGACANHETAGLTVGMVADGAAVTASRRSGGGRGSANMNNGHGAATIVRRLSPARITMTRQPSIGGAQLETGRAEIPLDSSRGTSAGGRRAPTAEDNRRRPTSSGLPGVDGSDRAGVGSRGRPRSPSSAHRLPAAATNAAAVAATAAALDPQLTALVDALDANPVKLGAFCLPAVTCIAFLDPLPALLTGHEDGSCRVWAMPPAPFPFTTRMMWRVPDSVALLPPALMGAVMSAGGDSDGGGASIGSGFGPSPQGGGPRPMVMGRQQSAFPAPLTTSAPTLARSASLVAPSDAAAVLAGSDGGESGEAVASAQGSGVHARVPTAICAFAASFTDAMTCGALGLHGHHAFLTLRYHPPTAADARSGLQGAPSRRRRPNLATVSEAYLRHESPFLIFPGDAARWGGSVATAGHDGDRLGDDTIHVPGLSLLQRRLWLGGNAGASRPITMAGTITAGDMVVVEAGPANIFDTALATSRPQSATARPGSCAPTPRAGPIRQRQPQLLPHLLPAADADGTVLWIGDCDGEVHRFFVSARAWARCGLRVVEPASEATSDYVAGEAEGDTHAGSGGSLRLRAVAAALVGSHSLTRKREQILQFQCGAMAVERLGGEGADDDDDVGAIVKEVFPTVPERLAGRRHVSGAGGVSSSPPGSLPPASRSPVALPAGIVWEGSWRAHGSGDVNVTSISVIHDTGVHALLTAANDGLTRLWDSEGRLLGTLEPRLQLQPSLTQQHLSATARAGAAVSGSGMPVGPGRGSGASHDRWSMTHVATMRVYEQATVNVPISITARHRMNSSGALDVDGGDGIAGGTSGNGLAALTTPRGISVAAVIADSTAPIVIPSRFQRLARQLAAAAMTASLTGTDMGTAPTGVADSSRKAESGRDGDVEQAPVAAGGGGGGLSAPLRGALAGIPPTLALAVARRMLSLVAVVVAHRRAPGLRFSGAGLPSSPLPAQVIWHITWDLQARYKQQINAARQALALAILSRMTTTAWWLARIGRRARLAENLFAAAMKHLEDRDNVEAPGSRAAEGGGVEEEGSAMSPGRAGYRGLKALREKEARSEARRAAREAEEARRVRPSGAVGVATAAPSGTFVAAQGSICGSMDVALGTVASTSDAASMRTWRSEGSALGRPHPAAAPAPAEQRLGVLRQLAAKTADDGESSSQDGEIGSHTGSADAGEAAVGVTADDDDGDGSTVAHSIATSGIGGGRQSPHATATAVSGGRGGSASRKQRSKIAPAHAGPGRAGSVAGSASGGVNIIEETLRSIERSEYEDDDDGFDPAKDDPDGEPPAPRRVFIGSAEGSSLYRAEVEMEARRRRRRIAAAANKRANPGRGLAAILRGADHGMASFYEKKVALMAGGGKLPPVGRAADALAANGGGGSLVLPTRESKQDRWVRQVLASINRVEVKASKPQRSVTDVASRMTAARALGNVAGAATKSTASVGAEVAVATAAVAVAAAAAGASGGDEDGGVGEIEAALPPAVDEESGVAMTEDGGEPDGSGGEGSAVAAT